MKLLHGIVSALSVHQLAAQGEMLYLATRIEQENVINHTDEEGFTPLMWAAAHGQIAVVEFLLQNVRRTPQTMYMYSYSSSVKYIVVFVSPAS